MQALTASSVKYNPDLEDSIYSPYDLVDGKTFDNSQILPYDIKPSFPEDENEEEEA